MRFSGIAIAAALLALAPGCANKFYTAKLDPDLHVEKDTEKHAKQIDGVIVYQPKLVKLTYKFTAITDADGNIVATAAGAGMHRCIEQEQRVEFKTMPDYSQRYVLRNVPSQFASGSLQVQLTDGMITSVNTVSDPQLDETIMALATLTKEAAGAFAAASFQPGHGTGEKYCSAAPVLRVMEDVR